MRILTGILGVGAAALVLSPPARADVTPAEVWEDLSQMLAGVGYEVVVTPTESGDTLRLEDLSLRMAIPEAEGQAEGEVTVDLAELVLEDLGDGTVALRIPNPMPIEIRVTEEGSDPVEMTLELAQEALSLIASGDPDALSYAYSAEATRLWLVSLTAEGEALPSDFLSASLATGPLSGSSEVSSSDGARRYTHSYQTDELRYDLAGRDPEAPESTAQISGRVTGLSSEGESVIPEAASQGDAAAIMGEGFEGSGRFTFESGQTSFAFTDAGETMTGSSSSQGGALEGAIDGTRMRYALQLDALSYEAEGGDLPFPVSAALEEVALNLSVPLATAEAPQDMALGLTLGGLTVSDAIWGIFDPGASLPRDPATLAFDVTGKVTPLVSVFDPAGLTRLETEGGAPAKLNALTLNSLTVSAAGAEITGRGDFSFDQDDLESFGGMPAPEGEVTFNLSGANGLIDKLIAMGLMSEQDAMGARMMLGMFTVPGSEPDTQVSTIEVNDQGQVLANGQRIK